MNKEEKILKDRTGIIKLLKSLKVSQSKATKAIAKVKAVDLEELLRLSDIAKRHMALIESCERWTRINNELYKKLLVEVAATLRLTSGERDVLDGGD